MINTDIDIAKKAKAEAFAEFLKEQNPDVLQLMVIPLSRAIRDQAGTNYEISTAMNLAVDFIFGLEPFPHVSADTIEEVRRRMNLAPNYFCKSEVEIAANQNSEVVKRWGEHVTVNEIKVNISLSSNEPLQRTMAQFFWALFACLRQSIR